MDGLERTQGQDGTEAEGRRYYRSLEELAPGFAPGAADPPELSADPISRRRFLSLMSASAALAAGASSCSRIDRGAIVPYTKKPQEIVPGVATYYASTFPEGLCAQGVLVKTREGRAIHVEGSPEHPDSRGAAGLRAIADVLGVYDPDRLRQPLMDRKPSSWSETMARIVPALQEAKNGGKPVLLLCGGHLSPTRRSLLEDMKKALPGLRVLAWEPAGPTAELTAARALFGEWLQARPRFDRADVVVSFGADFLGDGSVPRAIREFAARRRPAKARDPMVRLWALEGSMSLTGARADHRVRVRPSRSAAVAFALARSLHETHGVALPAGLGAEVLKPFDLEAVARELGCAPDLIKVLAEDLKKAGGRALVLAGAEVPPETHAACHLINAMLGAEGGSIDAGLAPPPVEIATPAEVRAALEEAARGGFAAAIFQDVNPAYAWPDGASWKAASERIPLKIRIGLHEDETARDCQVVLAANHWIESWGDHEPSLDLLSLQQPAMAPLYDTRQAEDALLAIARALGLQAPETFHAYLMERWRRDVQPQGSGVPFERFWSTALHDGILRRTAAPRGPREPRPQALAEAAAKAAAPVAEGMDLVLAPGFSVLDGRYANNGWLQELPNPITTAVWGNPLRISEDLAQKLGLEDGDMARIDAGGASLEVPVLIQPGQDPMVATTELGHGRKALSVAADVGVNAFVLMDPASGAPALRPGARISKASGSREIPRTQWHHRMEGRDIVRSWSLKEYAGRAAKGSSGGPGEAAAHKAAGELPTLYPEQRFPGQKWGMAIDLSACVGCAGCVVACQSENNIPVVGPEQVARGREMHWIRIDRYYEGDPKDPAVVHQPMLCQNCDNAPCENVCPVNATTHSPDGLNQMAYNRCVGTRYCANNCPYKVRRFNFLDFTSTKREPQSLVHNPEVTVRPRGVMEKCTFCIQRIQDGRQRAKSEGRPLRDGEIRPACASACPAEAIVFGDLQDPQSAVSRLSRSDRGYKVLEALGVKPAVTYLADLRNPAREEASRTRQEDRHG